MSAHGTLTVLEDLAAAQRAAAAEVERAAREAVAARGRFRIALTGGTTVRGLYELLAAAPLPWDRVDAFFGDERCVPPDHPDSNYGMARALLLSRVPVGSVRRVEGERMPGEAADRYEAALREVFAGEVVPRFDLVLLGLGADGHVASLFPRSPALGERERLAVADHVGKLDSWRVTLTLPVLNAAAEVLFLVAGEPKAWALRATFDGACEPEDVPARLVRPASGRLLFLADRAAASRVDAPRSS